jgi:hypothetical protein
VAIKGDPTTLPGGASVVMASDGAVAEAVGQWRDPEFQSDEAERPPDPASVDVTVLNGSGRPFAAQLAADALRTKRYATSVGGNAEVFGYPSSGVFYAPEFRAAAKQIQPLLGPSATVEPLSDDQAEDSEVVVVVGSDFGGTLSAPPPPAEEPPPSTVDTESLVPVLTRVQRALGLRVLVPLKVAAGSEVRMVRPYYIEGSGGKRWPAVKLVIRVQTGYLPSYWGMTMTTMPDPPILKGETGTISTGGREYRTYYDGKHLMRLAWQIGGVTYWISNSLDNRLSAKTIQEIAKSTRPLGRAKLPKNRTPTEIPVDMELPTP